MFAEYAVFRHLNTISISFLADFDKFPSALDCDEMRGSDFLQRARLTQKFPGKLILPFTQNDKLTLQETYSNVL